MRYLISLILANFMFWTPAFGALTDVEKQSIFSKNILTNGGFESGKAQWTASAGTFAVTTSSPMIGLQHATWDAAASADTLLSTAVTIPAGMYGRNAVASCLITTASGSATHSLQAYDGSNILSSATVTSSTVPTRTSTNFIMPSSGSISLRIYANANEPSIAIDDCYLGPAEGFNISNVSQAQFIGSAYIETTGSCTGWTRTNTALGLFATSAACPGPTVDLNPGPGVIQTTDTDLPRFTVNSLPPGYYRVEFTGSSIVSGSSALSALRINDGTTTCGSSGLSDTVNRASFQVVCFFTYTTSGNRTFDLFVSTSTGTATLSNGASNQRVYFTIERFPLSSEQGFTPDVSAQSWSGYHDNTCSFARTNTSYGDPATDASCGLTERSNNNFGTVTGANNLPSITFTPKKAGRYFVSANVKVAASNLAAVVDVKMHDGTTTVAESQWVEDVTTNVHTVPISGIYTATSTNAVTLSLQTKASAGSVTIAANGATNASAIEWTIYSIDQAFPMPNCVSCVSSAATASSVKIASARLNCDSSSSIIAQDGAWISAIGNISGGACAVTIAGGVFSVAPVCTLAVETGASADPIVIGLTTAPTTTALSVDAADNAGADSTAFDFEVICVGKP